MPSIIVCREYAEKVYFWGWGEGQTMQTMYSDGITADIWG